MFRIWKKEKYQQNKKTSVVNLDSYDLKRSAIEYQKIMTRSYSFLLENEETVSFRFTKDAFYHLMGIQYLKYSSPYMLIEDDSIRYHKETFFNHILDETITYDSIDLDKMFSNTELKHIEQRYKALTQQEKFVLRPFKDCNAGVEKDALSEVISNRWNYFSEYFIHGIFGEELVIDFDRDKHGSLIDADKIFFKYLKLKERNLNLFIGYDIQKNMFYPNTFFLEKEENNFLYNTDGTKQKTLKILMQSDFNSNDGKVLSRKIHWANVRNILKDEQEFEAQRELYGVFNKPHITSKELEDKIQVVKAIIEEIPEIFLKTDDEEKSLEYIEKYQEYIAATKEEEINEVFDYFVDSELGIDITDANEHVQFVGKTDKKSLKLISQYKRYTKYLPILKRLEYKEVCLIYGKFFDLSEGNWTEEFVRTLIDEHKCYENKITLEEIGKIIGQKPILRL